jgi:hypothetical protein
LCLPAPCERVRRAAPAEDRFAFRPGRANRLTSRFAGVFFLSVMPKQWSCGQRHRLHFLEEQTKQKSLEPLNAGSHRRQSYDGILFQPGPRLAASAVLYPLAG